MLAIMVLCFVCMGMRAQKAVLSGHVVAIEDGRRVPIDYAVVLLKPAGLYATSDEKGAYSISGIDPGSYEVEVQVLGYNTIDTAMVLRGHVIKDFVMTESSFRLRDVHVVAEASKAGDATASMISRQAIDHSQTSSLRDIMQLLPGASFSNPDLSSAQSINIRTAAASDMNSLGTAIIVDGSPMSNNANMEGISTAINGIASSVAGTAASAAGAAAGSGVDVRQISTDNIESVEVIRGIPSVQYGDLTSGAVIINSKAGVEPLTIRFKTDPKIYQVSASKGLRISEKAGDIHVSGDYAYSNAKTTEAYAYYQRVNYKTLWSKRFDRLNTTTTLDLSFGKDTRNKNKDDESTSLASGGTNIGYRIATHGTWALNQGWLKTLRYDVSNSFMYKESFREQNAINAIALYSTNMNDGTAVSAKGQQVRAADGSLLTSPDVGYYAKIMPYTYFYHYDFYAKEINAYGKVVANFFKKWGDTSLKILAGADFKSDGNKGRGLVFPDGNPPQHATNTDAGYRERPLYTIPFVNQAGAFVENSFKTKVAARIFNLTAGLRFEEVNSLTAWTPRINSSFEVLPGALTLRGGYGITAKAPTVSYLYPNHAYYDQLNINTTNAENPRDRVVMATTYIFDTTNKDLEIAKNRKLELGFDLAVAKKYRLGVTFYDEMMRNGYAMGTDFTSFAWMPYRTYTLSGHDAQGNPVFELENETHRFFSYYKPRNNQMEHQYGVEYELNLGRFDAIRTSFFLNGAWMHTTSTSSGYSFELNMNHGSTVNSSVAVYDPQVRKYNFERALSTLRATHNIPEIGFVVTLTTQFDLLSKSWSEYHNDEYPQLYIDNADGQVKEFTSAMAADSEYSYMIGTRSASRFIVSRTKSFVAFNLNISKEIKDFMTASFYVNNLFNTRPLDPSEISKGAFTELGNPMYFGFELKIKL